MILYSFYIFDRHTECIYSKRWGPRPSSISRSARPQSSSSVASGNENPATGAATATVTVAAARKVLSREDDAKLVFGTIFSLRNMVRRLGGDEDNFVSYRTSEYKLHYYETPTRLKFVMLTDTKTNNLQVVLHQIWASLYIEWVVKNPLSPVDFPKGQGISSDMFDAALDRFIETVLQS